MTTTLYARPYDLDARGFYFNTLEDFEAKYAKNLPVEEYELQFIGGEGIDAKLFDALSVNQCTIGDYFEYIDDWDEEQKVKVIIAVGEVGYTLDQDIDDAIDLYPDITLKDLVEQFIEEGMYGPISEAIQFYLDTDKMARDLSCDYTETRIDGTDYVYRTN